MTWGDDLAELERWFRLTPADMAIVLGARGQPQRLERALMLTWMRAERTLASDVQGLPSPIIIYVAEQLHLTSAVLKGYRSHQQTRSVAAEAIREHLEVRTCTSADRQRLHGMLCEKVAHTGNTTALIQAAEDWLKEHHILKPTGETTIERLVYAARAEAEDRLFAQIAAHLSPEQQASLDAVCAPGTHDSQLAGFVKPPRNASAPAIVQECQRLKDMRAILIDAIEWGTITPNRLRQWAAVVRRLSAQALRRYVPEKRYTHLLAFVTVRCEEITNVIVEMFDVLVGKIFDKSDEGVETTKAKRAQVLQQGARHMRKIYDILVDAAIPPDKVRDAVFKYLPRERWMEHNTLYDAFERGEVTFLFEILERRFQHLRSFAPTVFQALQVASPRESNPLVEGLQVLSTLEGKTGRASQIPASTTVAFVPAKWKKAVQPDENAVHRQAWEMTLMHEVRNALRSGDLTVTGSQR